MNLAAIEQATNDAARQQWVTEGYLESFLADQREAERMRREMGSGATDYHGHLQAKQWADQIGRPYKASFDAGRTGDLFLREFLNSIGGGLPATLGGYEKRDALNSAESVAKFAGGAAAWLPMFWGLRKLGVGARIAGIAGKKASERLGKKAVEEAVEAGVKGTAAKAGTALANASARGASSATGRNMISDAIDGAAVGLWDNAFDNNWQENLAGAGIGAAGGALAPVLGRFVGKRFSGGANPVDDALAATTPAPAPVATPAQQVAKEIAGPAPPPRGNGRATTGRGNTASAGKNEPFKSRAAERKPTAGGDITTMDERAVKKELDSLIAYRHRTNRAKSGAASMDETRSAFIEWAKQEGIDVSNDRALLAALRRALDLKPGKALGAARTASTPPAGSAVDDAVDAAFNPQRSSSPPWDTPEETVLDLDSALALFNRARG
jgi:hypothetical protein